MHGGALPFKGGPSRTKPCDEKRKKSVSFVLAKEITQRLRMERDDPTSFGPNHVKVLTWPLDLVVFVEGQVVRGTALSLSLSLCVL